jgi:hypothetical protein
VNVERHLAYFGFHRVVEIAHDADGRPTTGGRFTTLSDLNSIRVTLSQFDSVQYINHNILSHGIRDFHCCAGRNENVKIIKWSASDENASILAPLPRSKAE